jgi:hypothetical protein
MGQPPKSAKGRATRRGEYPKGKISYLPGEAENKDAYEN